MDTLEQKVGQIEKDLEDGVSRTGEPVVPPAVFRWVGMGVLAVLAALGTLVSFYPEVRGLQVALALVTAVASVLGIASPGLRRQVVMLFAVGALLVGGTGCVELQRVGRAADLAAPMLLDCASDAATVALPGMLGTASEALGGLITSTEGPDVWEAIIQGLLRALGQFAPCAIEAVVTGWEQAGPGAGIPEFPTLQQRRRAVLVGAVARIVVAEMGVVVVR